MAARFSDRLRLMPAARAAEGRFDLTPREAAEILGVHHTTLKRWADAGLIPHIRTPGGWRRFRRADVEEFIQEHGNGVRPVHSGDAA